MRSVRAIVAVLLAAASVARADSVLPEEVRRYYEAWEYLATLTTVQERKAAKEAGGCAETLRRARDAMALVEAMELPFDTRMHVAGSSGRWLRPLPRYDVAAPQVAPGGSSMVVACRATLGSPSDLYQPAQSPYGLSAGTRSGRRPVSLGTELHQWVKTDAGWKRRSPTPILVD